MPVSSPANARLRRHGRRRSRWFTAWLWNQTRPEREANRLLRQARRLVGFFEWDPPMHKGIGN